MPGQPVADAGFIAHEQGFEAVEPGVGVFDHDAAAVALGVEKGLVVGLPVGGAAVARAVGLDAPSGTFLPKAWLSKPLSAFRNRPARAMPAASRNTQLSPNKAVNSWLSG